MKQPRMLVDVDGVLADFLTPSLAILSDLTNRRWVSEDFRTWDLFDLIPRTFEKPFFDAVNQPGWCMNIPVYEGAVTGITRLRELTDLYIVTSPMNHVPTWTHEREKWLREHFSISHKRVVHTSAKFLCLGDFLVDDKPANIEAWEAEHAHGTGLLWDQPYNRSSEAGYRVQNWGDIQKAVEEWSAVRS